MIRLAASSAAGSPAATLDTIGLAADAGADLVLLPELAPVPWLVGAAPPAIGARAEAIDGALMAAVRACAAERHIAVMLPLPLQHGGSVFNAAVLIDAAGAIVAAEDGAGTAWPFAAKLHLPPAREGFGEPDHFVPGPAPVVHRWRGLTLGALVCFDRRFPECWRALRHLGADIVLVPVGGPGGDAPGLFAAELRTHAKANGVAVLAACRAGEERVGEVTVRHEGESCAIGADGAMLTMAGKGGGLVIVDLDPATIVAARAARPFLSLLREDVAAGAYQPIARGSQVARPGKA
ncbi:carbon-nitrogen hydrolase family protein [Elioraea sp.]|uniref:carbon-nitrogen hydrolase family protein n=1 Tax=Elioraea sp. TaxID=2185103 RepID=UPI0025C07550|nr:carbon-nitrogen hydrolase family protein [Elioraea sp.]